jgi:hypothetical protein
MKLRLFKIKINFSKSKQNPDKKIKFKKNLFLFNMIDIFKK